MHKPETHPGTGIVLVNLTPSQKFQSHTFQGESEKDIFEQQ